jgi:hypothetical protein
MAVIKDRARSFMEAQLHQPFVPAGETAAFLESYELRIRVPAGKLSEFTDWMRGTSLEAVSVEGWPSSSGSHVTFGNTEFTYRVYYGQEPSEWK